MLGCFDGKERSLVPWSRQIARSFTVAATAWALLGGSPAGATTFGYELPGTGLPSQNPPYPSVATLTLTQTADGVQFVLDPNEASPGFGARSFIERLDFAYAGSALDAGDFRNDAGVSGSFSFESNPNNMDAGYRADVFHIIVDFPSSSALRFAPDQMSTWTILGTTLADFQSFATANNKPDLIFSVISVSAYSLPGPQPTPSNWVALVPEPGTAALLFGGLGGIALSSRRRAAVSPPKP